MVDLSAFVEVTLKQQDDFLKVKETLTRDWCIFPQGKDALSILPHFA
jgi:hypothetical protein